MDDQFSVTKAETSFFQGFRSISHKTSLFLRIRGPKAQNPACFAGLPNVQGRRERSERRWRERIEGKGKGGEGRGEAQEKARFYGLIRSIYR